MHENGLQRYVRTYLKSKLLQCAFTFRLSFSPAELCMSSKKNPFCPRKRYLPSTATVVAAASAGFFRFRHFFMVCFFLANCTSVPEHA